MCIIVPILKRILLLNKIINLYIFKFILTISCINENENENENENL